jgi:hypothetical protein
LEICGGREGDDAHMKFTAGDIIDETVIDNLHSLLACGAYAIEINQEHGKLISHLEAVLRDCFDDEAFVKSAVDSLASAEKLFDTEVRAGGVGQLSVDDVAECAEASLSRAKMGRRRSFLYAAAWCMIGASKIERGPDDVGPIGAENGTLGPGNG